MNVIAKTTASRPPSMGDDRLMALIAEGDQQAFACLMEKYRRRMLALARRLTGSAADADEILQEAFLKIWMAAPTWTIDGPAKFSTWFYRIVVNACLDRKRQRAFASLDEAVEIPDIAAGAFEGAVAAERHAAIVEAMSALPDRQRSALSLHYFNELSAPEAAKALGVSVASLESLLFRGKRTLRDALRLAGALGLFDLM